MFSGSLLSTAALAAAAASIMSPSKCGKVKVTSTRYRNDPYCVRVTPKTPMQQAMPEVFMPAAAPQQQYEAAYAAAEPQYVEQPAAPAPLLNLAPVSAPASRPMTAQPEPAQHWAKIQFKREAAYYMAPFRIAVGDRVVVECDRGENFGTVAEITDVKPDWNVPSSIIRRATAYDDSIKTSLVEREVSTTGSIQRLAESLGLGIRVVDTEYQLDGNKLTVFFSSRVFVDFRKLQRSLFREHRCRIWLVNANEIRADVARLL